ncbi:PPR repeat, partial [Musa troglodytarum]
YRYFNSTAPIKVRCTPRPRAGLLNGFLSLATPLSTMLPDSFALLKPLCLSRCGSLDSLKKLHVLLVVTGLIHDRSVVLQTTKSYLRFDQPLLALSVFETAENPTLYVQNLVIRCLSHHGFYSDLLRLYSRSQYSSRHRIGSDEFTFPFVIKACSAVSGFRAGKEVHCVVLRSGYGGHLVVQTALLHMYAKTGRMEWSRKVFDDMSGRDLISWNALISGYSSNGLHREAFEGFWQMQADGLKPNSSTFLGVIPLCRSLGPPMAGDLMHGLALKCGAFSDKALVPTLISMYAGWEDLTAARLLFDLLPSKDLVVWNAMISGYSQNGKWDEAIEVFQLMHHSDARPDIVTLVSVLSSCSNLCTIDCGKCIHAIGIKLGISDQSSVVAALVSMYAKHGEIDSAEYLFHRTPEKSLLLWNPLISGYLLNGLWDMVLGAFHNMQLEGVLPDDISMINVISGCTMAKDLCRGVKFDMVTVISILSSFSSVEDAASGMSFHALTIKNGCNLDLSVVNALISMYMNFGDTEAGNLLFNEVMILFNQLRMDDQKPNSVTLLNVLPACESLLQGSAIRRGFESHTSISNCLMYMFARCGSIPTARKVFDDLEEKDSISWSVMINGYGMHGDGKAALLLFSMMKEAGWQPDDITFVSVLSACSHAGLVEQGRTFFKSMTEDHGITPRMEHYACMVDLFGRTGHLDEAYDIIKCLPFKPSASLLESLLGACQNHGNAKIGEAIGKLLIEYRPSNASSYVMLSNIYAAAGQWTDYGRVRCDMEVRGVKKDPGISLVQVK